MAEKKKIVDLEPGNKGFNITVQIVEKEEARTVQTKNGARKVANAKVKDDTGEIAMTLWGEDATELRINEFIRVENGLVGDWQDKKELTAGKYGKIIRLNE